MGSLEWCYNLPEAEEGILAGIDITDGGGLQRQFLEAMIMILQLSG